MFETSINRLNKYSKIVRSSKSKKDDKMRAALVMAVESENLMAGLRGEKRKACAKLINASNSYLNLMGDNIVPITASVEEHTLRPLEKDLRKKAKMLISSLTSSEEETEAKKIISKVLKKTNGTTTNVANISDSIRKEIREELKNESNRKLIQDLGVHAKKVMLDKKALDTKLFVLARVPIIIVSNDRPAFFKNVGFEIKELNRYVVIEDQLLVGVNTNKVPKADQEELLRRVIDSINLTTPEKFRVVGKPHQSTAQPSVVWYWLVPEKTISQYRKANNAYFSPRGWGFAFN